MCHIRAIKNNILTTNKLYLNPKIFLIIFGLFFSSLAFAAALTVTWQSAINPGANNNFSLFKEFSHISTGGWASLEFLSGNNLPAIYALEV